jgi:hypothetical protein
MWGVGAVPEWVCASMRASSSELWAECCAHSSHRVPIFMRRSPGASSSKSSSGCKCLGAEYTQTCIVAVVLKYLL